MLNLHCFPGLSFLFCQVLKAVHHSYCCFPMNCKNPTNSKVLECYIDYMTNSAKNVTILLIYFFGMLLQCSRYRHLIHISVDFTNASDTSIFLSVE